MLNVSTRSVWRDIDRRAFLALLLVVVSVSCDGDGTGPERPVDETPPFVVSTSPSDGSQNVPINARITVLFSEPLAPASVTSAALTLSVDGSTVAGAISRDDLASITFTPANSLDISTGYDVTVTPTVTDTAGNALAAAETFSFETAAGALPQLSESLILGHIEVLAADSMRGRRTGSEYELRAALYISEKFQEMGLEPGVPEYLQNFDIPFAVDGKSGLVSRNVLGVLPGVGSLAGQWVIVGAHYDHVGFREASPDSIEVYNGADDNASGTALLLDMARAMSAYAAEPGAANEDRRSLMFQAYGAEEVGLVGSYHYCENPTVSMDSVVAMINLDMVGRLRNDELILIGASSSEDWYGVLNAANIHALELVFTDDFINRSDQACFYQLGRPVAFFHTGLHAEYHTPYDDVVLINTPGIIKVGDMAVGALTSVALQPVPLSPSAVARPQLVRPVEFHHLGVRAGPQ